MAIKDAHEGGTAQLPPEVCEAQGKFLMEALSTFKPGQVNGQLRETFDDFSKRCGLEQFPQAQELLNSLEEKR